jgi:site-specific recombinase XerD
MADSLYRRPYFWVRLRANPLGELIKEYVAHFRELGYSWLTVRAHVQALEHFGCWLRSNSLCPKAVNRELVRRFIRGHLPRCHCPHPAPVSLHQVRPALKHLLRLLRAKGELNEVVHSGPIDAVIDQFGIYLRDVCGLSESTRTSRTGYAREFLKKRFGRRELRWKALRPSDVISFVTDYAPRYRPQSIQGVASSLRCFLRYLQVQGQCDSSLVAAVPRVAHWRLSSVPKALSDDQVREFLTAFDRSTANGCRNYAMALCQVILGLRVGEVVKLRLDDIDWRTGTVRIEESKGHRRRELPLPTRVGKALIQYLCHKRPPGRCRNVFVRHKGARGAPLTVALTQGVMRLAYAKVASCRHVHGTHVLRHTAATRMLHRGARIKEIADVLGHRSIETTAIYTKVDLPKLTAIALPWPEVRP